MYFVFVSIVILFYFLVQVEQFCEEKKRKWFCFLAFLVILFVHFFKDDSILPDLDRDGGGYKYEFEFISELENLNSFFISYFVLGGYFHEIGWSLLNYIISRFTDDFTVFQKVVSLGICAGYSYGIYMLSKNPLFSFIFLMLYPTALFQSFYVLRQHLAQALFFFLIPSIVNNDYKRVFLGFAVIISLHYSALILLPYYFFYRLGNKLYTFKRLLFAISLLIGFVFLINNITYAKYAAHINEEASNTLGLILTGGIFLAFIIPQIIYRKKLSEDSKYDKYIKTYMLYSVIICFACLGSAIGRLTNYFTIFLSISVPYSVYYYSKPLRVCAYTAFIVYCLISAFESERGLLQYQLIF